MASSLSKLEIYVRITLIVRKILSSLILIALTAVVSSAAIAEMLRSEPHYARIAEVFSAGLPQVHLTHEPLDNEISATALDNFLNSLDHDHSFFLQMDVDEFRKHTNKLDDLLRDGRLEYAYAIYEVLKQRAANRVEYVEELLEKGFDTEKNERHVWRRKDLPWADGEKAWDELWRKKIKNEYLGHVVGKILSDEEAEKEKDEKVEKKEKTASSRKLDLSPEDRINKNYSQFLHILKENDAEWVLQAYLSSFAGAYDTHSAYMSPRADEDFDIAMSLSLRGIGALLTLDDGAAQVVRLIHGGPAEKDGRLKPNDKIIAVAQGDGESQDIMYWPLYKSVRLIRGEIGTKVVLSVIPDSDASGTSVEDIDLIRDEILLEDSAAKSKTRTITNETGAFKLGVLTLPDFYADLRGSGSDKNLRSCSADVKTLLGTLKEENVDGVLLDLRNNGGGSLVDAIKMTGFFIESGPIVQVKSAGRVRIQKDPDKNLIYGGPLVVLVNRMSASASEILAGALQDYGRAIIVGDSKTHGKGSVQSVFAVDQRNKKMGSMKITTAGFYRIDGRSTQLEGVHPDIIVSSPLDVMEVGEEFLPNVLTLPGIDAVRYSHYKITSEVVSYLNKLSQARRSEGERFKTFEGLLAELKIKSEKKEISLNLKDRIELARNDKDFNERLKAFSPEDEKDETDPEEEVASAENDKNGSEVAGAEVKVEEEDDNRTTSDLVLEEGLMILRDLVEYEKKPIPNMSSDAQKKPSGV